jgi:hypothetical protein
MRFAVEQPIGRVVQHQSDAERPLDIACQAGPIARVVPDVSELLGHELPELRA